MHHKLRTIRDVEIITTYHSLNPNSAVGSFFQLQQLIVWLSTTRSNLSHFANYGKASPTYLAQQILSTIVIVIDMLLVL